MFIENFQERVHRSGSDSDLCIEETEINAAGDHVSTFPQQHRVGRSVLTLYLPTMHLSLKMKSVNKVEEFNAMKFLNTRL